MSATPTAESTSTSTDEVATNSGFMTKLMKPVSRRRFLRRAGMAGAALPAASGLIVAACYDDPTGSRPATATTVPTGPTVAPSPTSVTHNADQMDASHQKEVELFLQNIQSPITEGRGNQPLDFEMDGDTKVFRIELTELEWETTPGNFEQARAYNGMVPGPVIRATEGDKVRVIVKNNLSESTGVHFHGLLLPNGMDGVPLITQDPIKPGTEFTYEMTLRNWGTHMYHSHHNAMEQTNRGLLGAFIIDPKDPSTYVKYDKEYIMVINDTFLGLTLNGKGFPATEAVTAKKGEKLLIRYMNEGEMPHPMHLHGMPQQVVAIDGYPLANPYMCDTVLVAPGNRYDVLVDCTEEGVWAFHCHILSHAEGAHGMFGMVTVLSVTA